MTALSLCVLAALAAPSDTVLVQFTSQQCSHCQTMQPVLQRMANEGCPVQAIDVDQQPDLAQQFQVTGVPTFVVLTSGRETGRVVGAASYDRLVQLYRGQGGQEVPEARPLASDVSRNVSEGLIPTRSASEGQAAGVPAQFASTTVGAAAPVQQASYEVATAPAPQQAAMATAVRLKVEDGKGFGFGTGTIIDVHDQEALVITCGHIFRDSEGKGPISVDLFAPGASQSVAGTLLAYDLDRDVALVSIRPGITVTAARVAPPGTAVRPGDAVFTIGCDKGADATIRQSKIVAINKYLGRPNYTSTGAPTDGRSGGGLFTADGLLIGVCNAADPADNEGLYAALASIHWQLDQIGQSEIYQRSGMAADAPANEPAAAVATAQPAAQLPVASIAPAEQPLPSLPQAMPGRVAIAAAPANALPADHAAGLTVPIAAAVAPVAAAGDDTEIVFIVRSKRNPEQRSEVFVVDQAAPELISQISEAARSTGQRRAAALTAARGGAALPGLAQRSPAGDQPVVRGQSEY